MSTQFVQVVIACVEYSILRLHEIVDSILEESVSAPAPESLSEAVEMVCAVASAPWPTNFGRSSNGGLCAHAHWNIVVSIYHI